MSTSGENEAVELRDGDKDFYLGKSVMQAVDNVIERIAPAPNVRLHAVAEFEDGVGFVRPSSFVLSITKGHSSDRPVLREVLRRHPDIPFLGAIGSASKRAVLLRELGEDGIPRDLLETIVCPLGLPIGGNDPAEIAISVAAQLLERRGS